jgi:hypothetical protein
MSGVASTSDCNDIAVENLGFCAIGALLAGGPIAVVGLFSMGIVLPQIARAFSSHPTLLS